MRLYEIVVRRRSTGATSPGVVRVCADAARVAREFIGECPVECLVAIHLDGKHRIIGVEEVARGGTNAVHVTARDVFRGAIA